MTCEFGCNKPALETESQQSPPFHHWERVESATNQFSGWLSPIDSGGLLKAVLATDAKLGRSFEAATAPTNPSTHPSNNKVGVM